MYCTKNFATKAALKRALQAGETVSTFQPGGLFPAVKDGKVALEGPHYPKPHTWYASAQVRQGVVVPGSLK